jgi:hypothetical protein
MSARASMIQGMRQDSDLLVTAQAVGALVLALRVAPEIAGQALRETADRYGVAVEALAAEVVSRAAGQTCHDTSLSQAVHEAWGDLLD